MQQGQDNMVFFGILAAPLIILILGAYYINVIRPFSSDRRYIKTEIERSCDKREYRYWKRELKRLYISLIPIIGKMLVKYIR